MQTKEVVQKEQYIATREVSRTLYIAEDGRVFNDEIKCLKHEDNLKLAKLYIEESNLSNSEIVALTRLLFTSEDESDCLILKYKYTGNNDIVNKLTNYINEKYDVKASLDIVNYYNEGEWIYLFYWNQYEGSDTWREVFFRYSSVESILTTLDNLKQKI